MLFEDDDFIHSTIEPSKKLFELSSNVIQCSIQSKYEAQTLFFYLIEIPKYELQQITYINRDLPKTIAECLNEIEKTKEFPQDYTLSYEKTVIVCPYVCVFHEPIIGYLISHGVEYTEKVNLMVDLSLMIKNMHDQNICMRSLNSSNIIVKSKDINGYKLAFAQVKDFVGLNESGIVTAKPSNVGSFTAPEIKETISHTLSCDIWNLGFIFYEIFFEREIDIRKKNVEQIHEYTDFPDGTPKWIINFISRMLHSNPEERQRIGELLLVLKNAQICSETANKFFKVK